ncbi:hypothetical protein [Streptomyces sp. NBC_01367]|uniref:hypothetical protein n=1 Tax=unclassified Streptomyces TaxID=2593676 RepID=UPI003870798B
MDGSHIRAKKGRDTDPPPVDRQKAGSEHHLTYDGRAIPLKVLTTAANVNEAAFADGCASPHRPQRVTEMACIIPEISGEVQPSPGASHHPDPGPNGPENRVIPALCGQKRNV